MNLISQFGHVRPPPGLNTFAGGNIEGLPIFLNLILRLLIAGAGIFTLFNIILAGFGYISAGGDPKKISEAGSKIWQSVLGLIIVAGSFVFAAILGIILFRDANAILQIKIFLPQ